MLPLQDWLRRHYIVERGWWSEWIGTWWHRALRDHLHRTHMQYKAFKEKRIRTQTTDHVLTVQMDWSENPKVRQSREEKSAYYLPDQYSIHAMRIWTSNGAYSHIAMSDVTTHKAPAIFASIKEILLGYINDGVREINAVSDSPSSQYRNIILLCVEWSFVSA